MYSLKIGTNSAQEIVDLTKRISDLLHSSSHVCGVCTIFVAHTTCALTLGEIEEGTGEDFLEIARKIIPQIDFRHLHNPSHAWSHMAASLIGCSLSIPIIEGKLTLGTWQRICLVELDGPRKRNVIVAVTS